MTGRVVNAMYKSKVPALLGNLQAKTNQVITASQIVEETKLTRPTVSVWLDPKSGFKNLNAAVALAFLAFFRDHGVQVALGDLVDVVEVPEGEVVT